MVGSHNRGAWFYPWLGPAGYRYYTVKALLLQKVKSKLLNLSLVNQTRLKRMDPPYFLLKKNPFLQLFTLATFTGLVEGESLQLKATRTLKTRIAVRGDACL